MKANRAARRSGERPNGDRTGRAIQNGIRIKMYSRHKVIRICPRSPPCPGSQPGEKNTCTAAVRTRPWAAWMARTAVSARHHQRAAQAVCGSAYRARHERRGGGQQHHGHQPDHVDRRQDQGQDDPGQLQQDQEDPVVETELPSVVISDGRRPAGSPRRR